MSIYGQIIILLACYKVVITFASLALVGVHKRPVEVLAHNHGNLEAKWNLNTGQIIIHICMNETHNNKYTLNSTPLATHNKTIFF